MGKKHCNLQISPWQQAQRIDRYSLLLSVSFYACMKQIPHPAFSNKIARFSLLTCIEIFSWSRRFRRLQFINIAIIHHGIEIEFTDYFDQYKTSAQRDSQLGGSVFGLKWTQACRVTFYLKSMTLSLSLSLSLNNHYTYFNLINFFPPFPPTFLLSAIP